jgi:hypothetical protein
MSSPTHALARITLGVSLLAAPRFASATENADECADAYELAQSEQLAGRLFNARKDARLCTAKCPKRLATDCASWETRITAQIPSFVVHARGADGAPLAVEVQVDGAPAAPTETGAIEAEPGPHRLSIRRGRATVEAHVNLVAGARNQLVELTIADAPAAAPVPAGAAAPGPADEPHPIPTWRWILGGLGATTVAAGGAVSLSGEVLYFQLQSSCKPHCTTAQGDEVMQRWIIGGTVMGVGGAIFLGALLWPSGASPSGQSSRARITVGPTRVGLEVVF